MEPTEKPKKKPGPKPRTIKTERHSVMLEPDIAEWAKEQEGGMSGIIRRLLRKEYEQAK